MSWAKVWSTLRAISKRCSLEVLADVDLQVMLRGGIVRNRESDVEKTV